MADEKPKGMNVKISDEELRGRYANLVRISHTREEFILDFIRVMPKNTAPTASIDPISRRNSGHTSPARNTVCRMDTK